MKCTTVNKTMDGSVSAKPEMEKASNLGTHYVRSVTYGAEMVASLKFKSSSIIQRSNLTGKSDGGLGFEGVASAGLETQLKKLSSDCDKASDLSIEYYATDLPDRNPTTLGDLVKFIQEFPSRLEKINNGQGVPIQIELQPIVNVFPALIQGRNVQASECEIDEIESRYDDLCQASHLVQKYRDTEPDKMDDEMRKFNSDITKTLREFRSAISSLDADKVRRCLQVYVNALDGNDEDDKFVRHFRGLLKKKVPSTNIKLPSGKCLTVVLLGKTGNGKSLTGNRILSRDHFQSSPDAQSVTKECRYGSRIHERGMNVIDTPGVLDTGSVSMFRRTSIRGHMRQREEQVLREMCRIFAMAPEGLDAIILVVKYGARFTAEDEQALLLLEEFAGIESKEFMILILTWGDQAVQHAKEKKTSLDELIEKWIMTLPQWVQTFIDEIKGRVVLFDNRLREDENPEAAKKQLCQLIEVIDKMNEGKSPFVNKLTEASKEVLDARIKKALDSSGFVEDLKQLEQEKKVVELQLKEEKLVKKERLELEEYLQTVNDRIDAKQKEIKRLEDEKKKELAQEAQTGSGGAATAKVNAASGWWCTIL